MHSGLALDLDAISDACRARGVTTLKIFGSAVTERFDPEQSDVDFLVEFAPGSADPFEDYFGLKEDLEGIIGRQVDLVMVSAVQNTFFAASAQSSAEELYAA
jgi:predicted nucleotidyltransferase